MRRARFDGNGRIVLERVRDPNPDDGEVLVRVSACGLCGSDRRAWQEGSAVTPGHEIAGEVVDKGDRTSVTVGSVGVVFLVAWCGACGRCRAGSRGACERKRASIGFDHDGGFAELVSVPERCFLPTPGLDGASAVLLLDTVGTALHALRRARAQAEWPVSTAVVGSGPLGLGLVAALRASGIVHVVSVEPSDYRRVLAARLGAIAIEPSAGAAGVAHALGGRPSLVVEASGSRDGQRLAVDSCAPGGTVVLVGHAPRALELNASRDVIAAERIILGSEYFDPYEHAENVGLVRSRRLDPAPVLTHRFPLEEIRAAYELFWSGRSGKVVVEPSGG